jgi:hypothetical protein
MTAIVSSLLSLLALIYLPIMLIPVVWISVFTLVYHTNKLKSHHSEDFIFRTLKDAFDHLERGMPYTQEIHPEY